MIDLTIEEYFRLQFYRLEIGKCFLYKEKEYKLIDRRESTSYDDWDFYYVFVKDTDTEDYWKITVKDHRLCGTVLSGNPCKVIPKEKVVIEWLEI